MTPLPSTPDTAPGPSALEAGLAEVLRASAVAPPADAPRPAEPSWLSGALTPTPPVAPAPDPAAPVPTIVPGSALPGLGAMQMASLRLADEPADESTSSDDPDPLALGDLDAAPDLAEAGSGAEPFDPTSVDDDDITPVGPEAATVEPDPADRPAPGVAFVPDRPWQPEDDDILPAHRGRRGLRLRLHR